MRRHWTEVHGRSGWEKEERAQEVKMQTFFRGTKIRYFEVTVEEEAEEESDDDKEFFVDGEEEEELSEGLTSDTSVGSLSDCEHQSSRRESKELVEIDADMVDGEDTAAMEPVTPPILSPVNFDLETLKCFHQYSSTTCRTLPSPAPAADPLFHWQTGAMSLAFTRHWIMCGLLAISEYHMAVLEDDDRIRQAHRTRAIHLFAEFKAGREIASRHVCGVTVVTTDQEQERRIGGHIMCILRCANWVSLGPTIAQDFTTYPFKLHTFITALWCFPVEVDLSALSASQQEAIDAAARILSNRRKGEPGGLSPTSLSNDHFADILDRLSELPQRMSEVFGRPDNVRDVVVTISAIAYLVEYWSASFDSKSDCGNIAWHGMLQWLRKIPDHFRHMLSRYDPAALVVFAHWAASVVHLAESCGIWFLGGLPKRVVEELDEHLRENHPAACSLIEGLLA